MMLDNPRIALPACMRSIRDKRVQFMPQAQARYLMESFFRDERKSAGGFVGVPLLLCGALRAYEFILFWGVMQQPLFAALVCWCGFSFFSSE